MSSPLFEGCLQNGQTRYVTDLSSGYHSLTEACQNAVDTCPDYEQSMPCPSSPSPPPPPPPPRPSPPPPPPRPSPPSPPPPPPPSPPLPKDIQKFLNELKTCSKKCGSQLQTSCGDVVNLLGCLGKNCQIDGLSQSDVDNLIKGIDCNSLSPSSGEKQKNDGKDIWTSTGAIVGYSVGGAVILGLLIFAIAWSVKHKKK